MPAAGPLRRMAVRRAAGLMLALAAALLSGALVARGSYVWVLLAVGALGFCLWAISRPAHATLGLVAITPFSIYPVTVGGFSVFLTVPLVAFTSVVLLLRVRGNIGRLHRRLPMLAFAVLVGAALVATALSSAPTTAGSRVTYLVIFGIFAAAVASAIRDGQLSSISVVWAVVFAASAAAIAVIIQVVAQFAVGATSVTNWLVGELSLFAGAHTAGELGQLNWTVQGLGIVRGIFPFMDAPGAGQFLMLGLLAAVWLRLDPHRARSRRAEQLSMIAIVLIAAGLLMTFSRQSWVGAFVGLGALALRRRLLPVVFVILLLFLVMTVVPAPGSHQSFADYLLSASNTSTTSTSTRLGLWGQALHLLRGHWLIGSGPGLYSTLNPNPANPIYYAHNVFLDELVELGIFGGLALIILMVSAMASAFRRSAMLGFAMLAAWASANLFDDALFTPRTLTILAISFALAAAADRQPRLAYGLQVPGPRAVVRAIAARRTDYPERRGQPGGLEHGS